MSDNKRRLQQLSLLMPALAEIQMWSIATTAEYVRSIEQAIKADEQLSAANARVRHLEDLPLCRRQLPDGTVPENTEQALTLWVKHADALQATVEECRADAERYRFLRKELDYVGAFALDKVNYIQVCGTEIGVVAKTIDVAIDAARKAAEQAKEVK